MCVFVYLGVCVRVCVCVCVCLYIMYYVCVHACTCHMPIDRQAAGLNKGYCTSCCAQNKTTNAM